MKISSITADQSHGYNSSDQQVAKEIDSDGDESMRLSLDSESRWSLLNSFPAFFLSLLNLESEDSKLTPDGEFDFDWFQSNFPSPSFRSGYDFEVKLTGFVAIEEADRDGPLFWPLEHETEWKSMEDWDWFAISPRKKDLKSSALTLNSTGLRFHEQKITLNQAPKRRLAFNSRSVVSEMMELMHRRDTKASVPRIGAVPSRFNKGTRNPAGKRSDEKLIAVDRDFVEDLAAREEVPIETLLGLHEFDGREGFSSEFDDVVLSLDADKTFNSLAMV
ncbi:uncharacterized protein LOC120089130 [Benincasa hispida]|uniref:uncharacterized protein LOC120089130 n=1 Tax=Benincasa hispida TaxID=102211 RepID=UPI001900EDD1|nr:uncharacterized protein LOC120089130 [Benincasa hispida]XP_038902482.1 uncharacterized protein LOC120089130 [Benincasa hispida]XP_038902485.1 uncharacterized protein LOC120089130 [Benincasa hispida]